MQVNIALLTVTDTRTIDTDKSGAILMEKIKSFKTKNLEHANYFKLREESIKNILTQDFSGKYKTVEDY